MKWSPFLAILVFGMIFGFISFIFALPNLIPIINIFSWPLYSFISAVIWIFFVITLLVLTIKMSC